VEVQDFPGSQGVGPENPTKGAAAASNRKGKKLEKLENPRSPAGLVLYLSRKKSEQKFVLMPRSFYAFPYNFFSAFLSCYNSAATAVKNNALTPRPQGNRNLCNIINPFAFLISNIATWRTEAAEGEKQMTMHKMLH